ncbi:MAG: alpha-amylase family protein [Planctomycetota bacterium]
MAITNHARKQDKPPPWAAHGKLRLAHLPGGPSWMAVEIFSGVWERTPEELQIACRYSPALVEKLVARKFNAVCLTWSPGFSHEGDRAQWEIVRQLLTLLKKKKIHAIAQISLTTCFADEMFRRAPQAAAWLEHDSKGQPISNCNGQSLQMSVRHPGWRQYLTEKVNAAIIAGFDGIFIDDSFWPHDEETIAFICELRDRARQQRGYEAEDLLFYCDSFDAWPLSTIGNFIHYNWVERPGFNADGVLKTNIGLFKALFEAGGRDKPFASGAMLVTDEATDIKCQKLLLAETIANGGVCHNFALNHYQSFLAEHHALFSATDPINQIGLLFSDETADLISCCEFGATALARHNIQFDVIPTRGIEHFDLNKYKLIYAFHLQAGSVSVVERLQAFVSHGGALLVGPNSDSMDEHQQIQPRSEIFTLSEPLNDNLSHATPLGAGHIIQYAPRDGAESLWQLLEAARRYGGETHIEVQAPTGVVALLWGKGTQRWAHVINYCEETSEATITMPGCGGRKLRVYSPDEPAPTLRVLETGSACAAFTLSNIETYAIVEVV